jgi:hypothetical protein
VPPPPDPPPPGSELSYQLEDLPPPTLAAVTSVATLLFDPALELATPPPPIVMV